MTDIKKSIAQGAASELTKTVVALLLPLLLTLVVALVPPVRDRILPVLPKPLLAVLVGISLSLNLALFFYVLYLRSALTTKLTPRFGVSWSRDLIPHCPACSKPLATYFERAMVSGSKGTWGFRCIQCKEFMSMYDDSGRILELTDAKKLLSRPDLPLSAYPRPNVRDFSLSNNDVSIMKALSSCPRMLEAEDIATRTGLHLEVVKFHLQTLAQSEYIGGFAGKYSLAQKGREHLINNKLLT
jgi:hypothetical protein